ncbi:hypothetical protein CUMW_004510 [Citrus unshiu]|nr:hypothetical protein CUMW_004510 [Citrus unshiu]
MGKSLLTHQTSLAKPEKSTCPGSDIFGLGKASTSGPSMGTPRLLGAEDEDCPLYLKASKMPFLISSAASKNRHKSSKIVYKQINISHLTRSHKAQAQTKRH